MGDRANACPSASYTGADGEKGEENSPRVGKPPLASLQAGLCLRTRCARGLESGDERETVLAEGDVHLLKNRHSISNEAAPKKRPRRIKRSTIWSPNLRWIST